MKGEVGTELGDWRNPSSLIHLSSPHLLHLRNTRQSQQRPAQRPDYTQLVRSRVGSEHCHPEKPILSSQPLSWRVYFPVIV